MGSDRDVLEFVKSYKWTIIFSICGFLFAMCIINYGFFKSLLIAICVAAGLWLGLHVDKRLAAKNKAEDIYYNE